MNRPITLCDRCDISSSCLLDYDGVPCRRNRTVEPTNSDHIRAMSDDELAAWMCQMQMRDGELCPPKHGYKLCLTENGCKPCWLEWLKKEGEK